jgi:hypothetical protein
MSEGVILMRFALFIVSALLLYIWYVVLSSFGLTEEVVITNSYSTTNIHALTKNCMNCYGSTTTEKHLNTFGWFWIVGTVAIPVVLFLINLFLQGNHNFQKVLNYLSNHPNASLHEISTSLKINEQEVSRIVRIINKSKT